jgi:hypothetical protein
MQPAAHFPFWLDRLVDAATTTARSSGKKRRLFPLVALY